MILAMPTGRVVAAVVLMTVSAVACGEGSQRAGTPGEGPVLRVGHFPNVTHAQALVAHARTREGKGWFEERLGPGAKVEWYTYNAGPGAMEALLANSIDLTYVGPNPALNVHFKSKGEDVRVIAGAARGGAALVVRSDSGIEKPGDFRGKKVATPQFGNTQDVSCRAWLAEQGFKITQTGGDVMVLPTQNSDQLALFETGGLDAAWTVEPWVSRLETEAGGKVLVEEPDAVTTVLVASARALRDHPDLVRKFTDAHRELTKWMAENADEAKRLVRSELKEETRQDMPPALLDRCWPRLRFDDRIALDDFTKFVKAAQSVGFLRDAGSLDRLVHADR